MTPSVCLCGRGPAYWDAFVPPTCLLCVPAVYRFHGPHIHPESDHWLRVDDLMGRLRTQVDHAVLTSLLDQLACTFAGQ